MNPMLVWLLTMLALSAILFVAEVFVPSHGVLSILATACLVVGVVLCFAFNRWLGIAAMTAVVILGPLGVSLGVSMWQRTPVGKRMVLKAVVGEPVREFVLVGSVGAALTELRPMGECEFEGTRIEARSELGRVVQAGRQVVVLSLTDGVVTVRPVETIDSNS